MAQEGIPSLDSLAVTLPWLRRDTCPPSAHSRGAAGLAGGQEWVHGIHVSSLRWVGWKSVLWPSFKMMVRVQTSNPKSWDRAGLGNLETSGNWPEIFCWVMLGHYSTPTGTSA